MASGERLKSSCRHPVPTGGQWPLVDTFNAIAQPSLRANSFDGAYLVQEAGCASFFEEGFDPGHISTAFSINPELGAKSPEIPH